MLCPFEELRHPKPLWVKIKSLSSWNLEGHVVGLLVPQTRLYFEYNLCLREIRSPSHSPGLGFNSFPSVNFETLVVGLPVVFKIWWQITKNNWKCLQINIIFIISAYAHTFSHLTHIYKYDKSVRASYNKIVLFKKVS